LTLRSYNWPAHPEDLFLIARICQVFYYFMITSSFIPAEWKGPFPFIVQGSEPIRQFTGIPSLIQSIFGKNGNFELVVRIAQ